MWRRMKKQLPKLGLGIGWRSELALTIDRRSDLGFVEVMAEDLAAMGRVPPPFQKLRQRGVTVIPHGVSLSLGGAEPLDERRVEMLGNVAQMLDAPFVSEHIAFVRADGVEAGHLLPLPRSRAAIDVLVANVLRAKKLLPVPLALENIATLFEWPGAEMDEAEFLTEVLERADVLLLLDVANVFANARNHGWDPLTFFDRIPLERLAYVHVAGGLEKESLYHDTHTHPVAPPVLELLEELCKRVSVPGVLLERDGKFPPDKELTVELDAIAAAVARGTASREECHVGK